MSDDVQIISHSARLAYEFIKAKGGDADKVLAEAGLSVSDIPSKGVFIPYQKLLDLFEFAAVELDDPNFGFHYSIATDPKLRGLILHIGSASQNLGELLTNWARYHSIYANSYNMKIIKEGDVCRIVQNPVKPEFALYRQFGEFVDTFYVKIYRLITGVHIVPLEVKVAHAWHSGAAEIEAFYGCPIAFDQPTVEVVFDIQVLDLPITSANRKFLDILLSHCDSVLEERAKNRSDVLTQTERHICDLLPEGRAKAKIVAEEMGISERTLSRRLADEGTSFAETLDQLRMDLAETYISKTDLQMTDVAFLLGYANQSAFTSAYKRWTGMTPKQARKAV